ncbi:PKD domain-containing protein [Haloplanus halophilus]|uniref:PKD domain-containing protein n=1 Tax=Haloplanus halophilus TaxID=2949993 RepID=UPI00273A5B62|nr:PKD domain-containing protein [Haloplanus sp. GDY1]
MNYTNHGTFRRGLAALVAAMIALSTVGAVGIASADPTQVSVTQTPSTTTVGPGDQVTFTVQVDATDNNAPSVQANLPSGWTLISQNATGGATFKSSTNEWIWTSGGTHTVDYTVQVPSSASGDGTVTADLSAINPNDDSFVTASASSTVTVDAGPSNQAPSASFTYSPADPETDESVSFDASASTDPDGSIASYDWDFGDGATATGASPSHTYTSSGTYTVELTVTDDDGATATAQETVTVSDDQTQPSPDMETTVSMEPSSSQTFVGGTTAYDLVIDDANGGVGAYSATVSVDDAAVGGITDVELQGSPAGQTTNVDIAGDGSSVAIDAALMDTDDTGSVTVATITLQGSAAGSTDLSPSISAIGNEQGTSYTVAGTSGAMLSVTEKSTSVSLSPTSSEIATDDSTEYALVVDDANGGVGAYTATVSLDDASVGQITDVELLGNPAEQTSQVDIATDGSSVSIDAALMNTADSGSVTVATITVEGVNAGSTDLDTSVTALGDEDGNNYAVTGTNGASLTVTEVVVGDFANPVTNADADEQYEDINGDGNFNIVDVQALFANLDDDAIQNNPDKFDFNGDGTVNIVDVQALFFELTG